jgi:hypothetical protein
VAEVLVLVDWENIHYTLERSYRLSVSPQDCLEQIVVKAREYGTTHVEVFYNAGLRGHQLGLAIRSSEAYDQPLYSGANEPEKNLADTYIATEALRQFYRDKPSIVIIVSGDNGYTPVLRAIRELGGKAIIFSFEKALANIIKNSRLVGEGSVLLDDLVLPYSVPLREKMEKPPYRKSAARPTGGTRVRSTERDDGNKKQRQPEPAISISNTIERAQVPEPRPQSGPILASTVRVLLGLIQELAEAFEGDIQNDSHHLPGGLALSGEHWAAFLGPIHDAVARGQLRVVTPDRAQDVLYLPNWEDPTVREVLITWVAFIGKLRYMTSPTAPETLLQSAIDQVNPPLLAEKVRNTFYFPDRDLLRTISQVAQTIGAVHSRKEAAKTWIRLVEGHPLIRHPIRFSIMITSLPQRLQSNIEAVESWVVTAAETTGEPATRLRTVIKKLTKYIATPIDIAVALRLIALAEQIGDDGIISLPAKRAG